MIDIPKSDPRDGPLEKGHWGPVNDPRWVAILSCPNCGFKCSLRATHEVAATGVVTPSVICPNEGCDWHEHVRLLDWPHRWTGEQETEDQTP